MSAFNPSLCQNIGWYYVSFHSHFYIVILVQEPSNMYSPKFYRILLPLMCFLVTPVTIPVEAIKASPIQLAQAQVPKSELDKFFNYLNQQKYTFLLGDDRGACSYHIDPTDVYKQGTNRFVMTKLSRGVSGTACRGVLEFKILQLDCQTDTLYQFARETEGDPRFRGWRRFEISLYNSNQKSTAEITQQICTFPAK